MDKKITEKKASEIGSSSLYYVAKRGIELRVQSYYNRKCEKLEESAHREAEDFGYLDAGYLFVKAANYARRAGNHQKEIDLLQRAASIFEEDAQTKARRARLLGKELLRRITDPQPYDFLGGNYEEDELLMKEQKKELLWSAYEGFSSAAQAIRKTGEPYFEQRYVHLNSKANTILRISFI